jgi:hypothetical protein
MGLVVLSVVTSGPKATQDQRVERPEGIHPLFELDTPTTAPFPSDWFTVPDHSQITRRRVNLPLPDCSAQASDCEDLAVVNALDGFNLEPQFSIPFDGAIDVTTVTSATVFLIRLRGTLDDADDDGHISGINRVVWDVDSRTLLVESDEFLDQHTRYALIVTRGIHDATGREIQAGRAFRQFRETVRGAYRRSLLEAVHAAHRVGVREDDIAVASVFTTQSATAIVEKMRDQIKAATPDPADFQLGPGDARTVFAVSQLSGVTFLEHTHVMPDSFTSASVPVQFLRPPYGDAVAAVAYGKYRSPDFEVHPGEFIPPVGTRTGVPAVQGVSDVYFDLFLPTGPKPPGGWPVTIFAPGTGATKDEQSFRVASALAAEGIATIGINPVGHGFGPLGTLTANLVGGTSVTFPAGGRGRDQDGNHTIDASEGFATIAPRTILYFANGIEQTAVDLMQLVRVIQVGVDVDGDGSPDLDATRISYLGHSLAASFGTVFMAVEPDVRLGVFSAVGAPRTDNRRTNAARAGFGSLLMSRIPPLLNAPGITNVDGMSVGAPYFNENYPLRDGVALPVRLVDGTTQDIQSPVINDVAGAIAIQTLLEHTEWAGQAGNPIAYSPHLRAKPLRGVTAKDVIFQFAKTDQSASNPNTSAVIRAGNLVDRTMFYRHDLFYAANPTAPKNPHPAIFSIDNATLAIIAQGYQHLIGRFFATDGQVVIHPEPGQYFEVPIQGPLPEALAYIH